MAKDYPPDQPKDHNGRFTEEAIAWFYQQIRAGRNPYKVGEAIDMSRAATRRYMKKLSPRWSDGDEMSPMDIRNRIFDKTIDNSEGDLGRMQIEGPITEFEDLTPPAQQAFKEFGYFRRRYLGRRNITWQIQMAHILMSWLEEAQMKNERIRGVLNTPPGGGKTTTVTHDLPAWAIARNRNLRVGLGSRTTPQATSYVRRLRNTLEKNNLLNLEFGNFKPDSPDVWRQTEFIVDGVTGSAASVEYRLALAGFDFEDPRVQKRLKDPKDEIHQIMKDIEAAFVTGEKEYTVAALSHQMGFLGGRYDLILWDDLVDNKNSKNPEQRDELAAWWEEYAVSRLEPGGVIGLIGTRFSKYDLYRYCRDMTYTTDDEFEDQLMERLHAGMTPEQISEVREDLEKELLDAGEDAYVIATLEPDEEGEIHPKRMQRKVYRYIRYPAHDDDQCPNPASLKQIDHMECILDPQRFRWHDLMRAREANPRKFGLTYQQLDESTEDNLVQEVWLTGGVDNDGITVPGCYNYNRRLLQIPENLKKEDCFSIATVDPSAVNYWSIQWWVWDATEDRDYLIDIMRARLSADSFLSYSTKQRQYHGIVDQWQTRSQTMGWPIGLWIIEEVAAQRYLFQHTWVHEWMQKTRTHIKGHETTSTKADPDFGIQTLRPRYRYGLTDLPFDQDDIQTRFKVGEFKKELVEYPDSQTDDMVNGHWFLQANRYKIPKSLKVTAAHSGLQHPFQDSMPDRLSSQTAEDRVPNRDDSSRPGHRAARVR